MSAPVVIGRDHLDSGSVASPYRETEAMRDGSDAIADWPILNALLNTAAGATWVSVHHGGGVGIGNSIHAGMVVLADGSADAAERLERVLTTDPGTGVMRHADAGYDEALDAAREHGRPPTCRAPDVPKLLIRDLRQVVSPAGGGAPLRGGALGELDLIEDGYVLCDGGDDRGGRADERPRPARRRGRGARRPRPLRDPGLVDCHTHPAFGGDRVDEFSLRAGGASYEELHAAGGGILSTVRATRGGGRRTACARRSSATAAGCCAPARRPSRASRATGSTARPSSPRCARSGTRGGVPTFLGAHATPPEFDDADAYLDFAARRRLPEAAPLAEAADVFLERGAFDADQARRYLEACREHGLALRLHGDQFTEAGAIPLAIELGARSVDHLEATGPDGIAALAASDVTGVLLPASALFLGRPMPPGARSSTPAPRSRSRPTSTPAAPSARACRS